MSESKNSIRLEAFTVYRVDVETMFFVSLSVVGNETSFRLLCSGCSVLELAGRYV